jgi:hypothetical protein
MFQGAVQVGAISRWIRYHRHLPDAGFSLEANTGAAPEPGYFYVLRGEEVLHRGDDFEVATVIYRDLCREHWQEQLLSTEPVRRIESAWGLLGHDAHHTAANAVIQEDGRPEDRERLRRLRNRADALRRGKAGQGRFRRPAAAPAIEGGR